MVFIHRYFGGKGWVKTSTDVYISGVYLMEREFPFLFSGLVGDVCLWLLLLGMLHPEQAGYTGGVDEAFHSHCVSCNNSFPLLPMEVATTDKTVLCTIKNCSPAF